MIGFAQGFIGGFIGGSVIGIMIMSLMNISSVESERERKEQMQEFWSTLDEKYK